MGTATLRGFSSCFLSPFVISELTTVQLLAFRNLLLCEMIKLISSKKQHILESFIHLSNKYLLITYCVAGTNLGPRQNGDQILVLVGETDI